MSKPRPRVQRATGPWLLRDCLRPALGLEPTNSSTLATGLSRHPVLAITLLLIFSCYCYRWAAFREAALDVSSLMAHIINCNSSTLVENHIGGGIYICVSPDTVHLLKCWQELHIRDSITARFCARNFLVCGSLEQRCRELGL